VIYIDDSIMRGGEPATAGSRILEGFKAPFDAEVITRLGGELTGVILGEFGLEPPQDDLPTPLLCNDIFGHIRKQAAKRGLCYIRPKYGTVSRYGLIPAACSMDQIGVLCESPDEGFALLARIAGHDPKDGAMLPQKSYVYSKPESFKGIRKAENLPYSDVYAQVLHILAYAEISNNISRYDGIKFGKRAAGFKGLNDLYLKTRTEYFGGETKLALVMGAWALSSGQYAGIYEKAMKIRRLIKESLNFEGYDALEVEPGNPLAVLAGLPSLTFNGTEYVAETESALLGAWEEVR
jgi:Asp-tRNA(Asn)/Glu-tRNA(Gln) amidotransferase A subunit family amidase